MKRICNFVFESTNALWRSLQSILISEGGGYWKFCKECMVILGERRMRVAF